MTDTLERREALIAHAVQYGPRCRDCADEAGVCPHTGIGCGEREKAVAWVVDALIYGAQHGFCPAALSLPAREVSGERIPADVERDAEGRVQICTGCGSVATLAALSRKPGVISCCPERKMVPALATTPAPREKLEAVLTDPNAVHVNMLRGAIAKPSPAQIWHIYGDALLADMPNDVRTTLNKKD